MVAAASPDNYDARRKELVETCPLESVGCAALAREEINKAEDLAAHTGDCRVGIVMAAVHLGLARASISAATDSEEVAARAARLIGIPVLTRLLARMADDESPAHISDVSRVRQDFRKAASLVVDWIEENGEEDEPTDEPSDQIIDDPVIRGEVVAYLRIVGWCLATPEVYGGRAWAPSALYKAIDMVRTRIRDFVDDGGDMVRTDERAATIVVELGLAGLRDRIDAIEHGRRTGQWTNDLEAEADRMVAAAIKRLGD